MTIKKISELTLLENNPRQISKENFERLKKSLQRDPEFLKMRPVLCYPQDGKLIIYAGNQRVRAAKDLGWTEIPVVIDEQANLEQIRQRILLDNVEFGEWDKDVLANNWEIEELKNLDLPELNDVIAPLTGEFGASGNDWNYNYKGEEQHGDGLEERLGFAPHSMWYSYPREVEGISEHLIALPERKNSNPHQDKYSRTSAEEIRRVVLTYMTEGDFFLENCCGWSTFGAIAKMHGYSGVGVDIWDVAIDQSRKQVDHIKNNAKVEIVEMDGMALTFEDDKFDYVYCNPPFMDVEMYSGKENDITAKDKQTFKSNFDRLMSENFRVLKKGKLCTITISDTRKNGVLESLQYIVLDSGFKAGFQLHDFVVVEVLGVANMYRKKAFEKKRMPKNHEYVITFIKP